MWHLVSHFFYDITHFDGKFFSTSKLLLTKPGFLSKEYMLGRRASYLNPIRMYVFTSAFFFLIFFWLKSEDRVMNFKPADDTPANISGKGKNILGWENEQIALESRLSAEKDNETKGEIRDSIAELAAIIAEAKAEYGDTSTRQFDEEDAELLLLRARATKVAPSKNFSTGKQKKSDSVVSYWVKYRTIREYDSAQQLLPPDQRDGWFVRLATRKLVIIGTELRRDKESFVEHIKENFTHSFPKILFFSLPFFAMILQLVYVRRKQFLYTNHGIFSIHIYC
ncbi:MAG TPA: DUF3667 domain-containing protein, partial [Puia sp.]|nr:DUF3667 domain-containing protein [Puia sp.]